MTINTITRRGFAGLLLAATIFSASVQAQDTERTPRGAAVLPCCKCLGEASEMNLSTGAVNNKIPVVWTVAQPGSAAQGQTNPAANPAWTKMLAPTAQWISPAGNPQTSGVYTYQTVIDARNCTIPSEIIISGKFLADNSAVLLVDGQKVTSSQGTPNYGFLPGSLTSFNYTIPAASAAGLHVVSIQATNTSSVTGIVVQMNASRKCSSKIEK